MAFTTSDKMKMVIFQDEVNGVLTDLMARSHVDNVIYEEGGQQKALSTKLAEIIAAIALKANSADVTAEIKAADDALYNKISGIPDRTRRRGAGLHDRYCWPENRRRSPAIRHDAGGAFRHKRQRKG